MSWTWTGYSTFYLCKRTFAMLPTAVTPFLLIMNLFMCGLASTVTDGQLFRTNDQTTTVPMKGVQSGTLGLSIITENNCNLTLPFPCECLKSAHVFLVNCSHRNLTSVPHGIPGGATKLILNHNGLRHIPAGAFRNCVNVETLDLSHNYISQLGSGIFDGLRRLKTLLINENLLNMSKTTFAADVFTNITNLTYLNIKSKLISFTSESEYPDVALGKLTSLDTLLISGLSNTTFGVGVKKMVSLRTLDLSHTASFTTLYKNTFLNFKNITLKNLYLNHCNLSWIHKKALSYLPYIDTIDYSYNEYLEIKGLALSTYGLQNSSIRKIVMQRIHAPPSMTIITKEDVQYLTHTKLEELHAENNSIGQIMGLEPILGLPLSLKVIRVSWNNIQTYKQQVFHCLRLINLEQADASNQEVYGTNMDSTRDLYADAFQSVISQPDILKDNTAWGKVNTAYNATKSNSMDKQDMQIYSEERMLPVFNLPPKLWLLNSSHTYKLKFTVPALEVANCSLTYVNFADNQLTKWEGPIKGAQRVLYLDLSGNDCVSVSDYFFAYFTGLSTLLIGRNKLGKSFANGRTFYNLTGLRHLDMRDNQLEDLGYNLFARMTNLTTLQLSQNYLTDFNVNISGLVKLKSLDLSGNKLRALPSSLCRDLDEIQKLSNVEVDIRNNPIQCNCDNQYFFGWLTETKVRFQNFSSTFCTFTNGTAMSLTASKSIFSLLQRNCRSYTLLTGVLSVGLSLVVIALIVKVIHQQRWKIRYLCYMASNWRKRTGYQRLDSTEDNPYGFDAFVSYEDSSRAFIREQVIPRLETETGLRLCIDKRDFVPGLYITDNILHAIQNSRKTVVFLSCEFLKSKWCMYELNMARMEGIYTGRQLLLVVLMEEIPSKQLTSELIDVIHKQTYIKMTNNRYGEALFWERLVSAIKSN
ncbi:toll-like receptor 4 [Liolophura sinensis]|uniref:toll-like receptor 4 n=1 Tax=Liolophura sinensis TaxID=3198878 RepID=UPI00315886E3